MKKTIAMALITSVALIGGGDVSPKLSNIVKISKKPCHNDTTFVDTRTHLMWQDAHYTPQEDGAFKNNRSLGKAGNLRHAVNYCRRLNYAGYSDWRLPTKEELMEVHRIKGEVFQNHRDGDFWSITPAMGRKNFVVFPADAYPYERFTSESNYIRCVRCTAK